MPDTGAPWNIPYVAGTDLVSDWPTDSLALANAIDAGLDAASVGIGTNVVQTVKTDVFTTTSATFTTVTGLTASITPSSASSKILVIAQINYGLTTGGHGHFKVTRGGTDIYIGTGSVGSRIPNVFGGFTTANNSQSAISGSIVYLDSPATTSSVTYQVETRISAAGSVYVNQTGQPTIDDANNGRGASSITVIEVAA